MRLTQQQLEAMLRLKENRDFQLYMQALGGYAEELTKNLIYCEPTTLDTAQGMTRGVVEVIKAIDKAKPINPIT